MKDVLPPAWNQTGWGCSHWGRGGRLDLDKRACPIGNPSPSIGGIACFGFRISLLARFWLETWNICRINFVTAGVWIKPWFLHQLICHFFHCFSRTADHEQILLCVKTTSLRYFGGQSIHQVGAPIEGGTGVAWIWAKLVWHGVHRVFHIISWIVLTLIFIRVFISIFWSLICGTERIGGEADGIRAEKIGLKFPGALPTWGILDSRPLDGLPASASVAPVLAQTQIWKIKVNVMDGSVLQEPFCAVAILEKLHNPWIVHLRIELAPVGGGRSRVKRFFRWTWQNRCWGNWLFQ